VTKRPGSEHVTDHYPPFSAEVKNAWNYTSTPPYVLISRWLIVKTEKRSFIFRGLRVCEQGTRLWPETGGAGGGSEEERTSDPSRGLHCAPPADLTCISIAKFDPSPED
jgi:hypothetical protein